MQLSSELTQLAASLEGDLYHDKVMRTLYATDASAYRQMPLAVARPRNTEDIKKLVQFARKHKVSLIPRAAGTSLAGQVVGEGIVVDVSKYMTQILELNVEQRWVRVQPGVVLDELNKYLAPHGLFFGPETSTANRCMLGGMLGNNACGAHSIIYGSTRDHTISVETVLSDGSDAIFKPLSASEFEQKCTLQSLEGSLYRSIRDILSDKRNADEITAQYPDRRVKRRNTGYAVDLLLDCQPFAPDGEPFNFSRLLAGSEGTLAFTTAITLNLVPAPPKEVGVLCVHFETLEQALHANLIALKYKPGAVELMDDIILECTRQNRDQELNRFFVKGSPKALLFIEFARSTRAEIDQLAADVEAEMRKVGYGYHFPLIYAPETKKVWDLRKAGLGLLSNLPGDAKPVSLIEDTAVAPDLLPDYIAEFKTMLSKHKLNCVYHAHIGSGELHLRPVLDLKLPHHVELFHTVGKQSAELVKKYKGSLSGEHGDGRLRGEFIPIMVGEHNYGLLKKIKQAWDTDNIFNPGKIVDTPPMNTSLRYVPGKETKQFDTIFDFSHDGGIVRAAERCNGSGDCRKSHIIGGTLCPSFQATRDEKHLTRARANILRETLTNSEKLNPFDSKEIYEVMDLCLSCKACKSECPSSVDVAKLKAEFLQHYYDANGVPLRSRVIANITKINRLGAIIPTVTNFFMKNSFTSGIAARILGFSTKRTLPLLYHTTFTKWFKNHKQQVQSGKKVYLFNDEFTNYNDTRIGIAAVNLLNKLGYEVVVPEHDLSARTYLSKGLLREAKKIANKNVTLLSDIISEQTPLLGIEPSAILTFRDEYPDLVDASLRDKARALAKNTLMVDEFLASEFQKGNIKRELFTDQARSIKLHGHCQQKAVASTKATKTMLSIPVNYKVEEIPSGCCGMAGSFGYEKEHYDVSMKVGELVLLPTVRKAAPDVIIAAPGTSCRHQIHDGAKREALHPVEILWQATL